MQSSHAPLSPLVLTDSLASRGAADGKVTTNIHSIRLYSPPCSGPTRVPLREAGAEVATVELPPTYAQQQVGAATAAFAPAEAAIVSKEPEAAPIEAETVPKETVAAPSEAAGIEEVGESTEQGVLCGQHERRKGWERGREERR